MSNFNFRCTGRKQKVQTQAENCVFNNYGYVFANFLLGLTGWQGTGDFPAHLDANGYPTTNIIGGMGGVVVVPPSYTGDWVFKFKQGTGALMIQNFNPTDMNITGGSFDTGVGNQAVISGSSVRRVQFNFKTPSAVNFLTILCPDGNNTRGSPYTYSGMGGAVLCRVADEAGIDAGTTIFNSDYIAEQQALNPPYLRVMGLFNVNNLNNFTQHKYRTPTTALTYLSSRYDPNTWAGTASGTNNYTIGSYVDMPGSYTDKETFTAYFTNGNTTSTATVNVGGRGVKNVLNVGSLTSAPTTLPTAGSPGAIQSGGICTFVYDSLLNGFMLTADTGITAWCPIEILVALANAANVNLWYNLWPYMNASDAQTMGAYISANLAANLSFRPEYGNEIWNTFSGAFVIGIWVSAVATAMGFTLGVSNSLQGLKTKQLVDGLAAGWGSRSLSTLSPIICWQGDGNTTALQTYALNGNELSAFGFDTAPNRPRDSIKAVGYATYWGAALFGGNLWLASSSAAFAAADDYASGDAVRMNAAVNFVYADHVGEGTGQNTTTGAETIKWFTTNVYQNYDTIAGNDTPLLDVDNYEGGMTSWYPTTGACISIGVDPAYGGPTGKIANLLSAFKHDARFQKACALQFNQFFQYPRSVNSAWYGGIFINDQWAMRDPDLYTAAYKSRDAIAAVNNA